MLLFGLLSIDQSTQKYREPVPFKGVSVEVNIEDFCSVVTIIQTYKNETSKPIEAIYRFPLHERTAINKFVAWIDNKRLVGQIQTSEKAAQTYDDAISKGKGAYLLEKKEVAYFYVTLINIIQRGIYEMSVGALPPEKQVKIELSYISDLDFEGNDILFELPTSISPACSPMINNTKDTGVTYPFSATIHLNMSRVIKSLRCPLYQLVGSETLIDKKTGTLKVEPSHMGSPFRLLIGLQDTQVPSVHTEVVVDGNTYSCAVTVNFCPEVKSQKATETEIIFVLDRSGSMGGVRITAAKSALIGALDLIAQTMHQRPIFFNVLGFGSNWTKLFDESELATENSVSTVRHHFENVKADLGGTEILSVLKEIHRVQVKPGRPRNIILLTDGEVGNNHDGYNFISHVLTLTVISWVQKIAATSRVFPFGIGPDVSRFLVAGMAQASKTRPEFVSTEHAVDTKDTDAELLQKVSRQITRSLQPAVMNVKIDWGSLGVLHQSPAVLPPLWNQEPYVIFALTSSNRIESLEKDKNKVHSLKLTGETQDGELVQFAMDAKMSEPSQSNLIHSMVARAVIFDLEVKNNKSDVDTIVSLSKKYKLVSEHTSFVAVEDREEAVEQSMALIRVPQPQPPAQMISSAVLVAPRVNSGVPMCITGAVSWRSQSIKYRRNELFIDFTDKLQATIASSGDLVTGEVQSSVACRSYLSGMPEVRMKVNHPGVEWYNHVHGIPTSSEVLFHQCVRTSQLKDGALSLIPPDGEFELMRCTAQENFTIPFRLVPSFFKATSKSLEITLYIKSTYQERCSTDVTISIPIPPDSIEQVGLSKCDWSYAPEQEAVLWKIKNFLGCQTEKLSVVIKYDKDYTLDNSKEIELKFGGAICVSGGSIPYVKVVERSGYKAEMWFRNHSEGTIAYRWGFPKL